MRLEIDNNLSEEFNRSLDVFAKRVKEVGFSTKDAADALAYALAKAYEDSNEKSLKVFQELGD